MIHTFSPADLQSLFKAFELLEKGVSVCLLPPAFQTQISHSAPASSEPHVALYSSGSTGTPKLFWRPWAQLKSELRLHEATSGWTWASPFSPTTFAGVQVALQAWGSGGKIISLGTDWVANWKLFAEQNVVAISCTPTFLDLTLHSRPPSHQPWTPSQITLGGEPLRPAVGRRLQSAFPRTRITVIYASAEFGVLLKTHRLDGWYEIASLQKRFQAWRIYYAREGEGPHEPLGGREGEGPHEPVRVWEGESVVKRLRNFSSGLPREPLGELQLLQNGHWISTRDLIEIDGDLLRILGRADSVVNIAGSKVNLEEVNRIAEEVPGVRAAFAFAEPNPVSGQIVALRFVPDNGCAAIDVQQRLEAHLRKHLRKEAWPRRWETGSIDLGPNAKRVLTFPSPLGGERAG